MSKKKHKIHWYDTGFIPNFYVGFTTSPKAYKKAMKKLGIENPPPFLLDDMAGATTHFFENDGGKTTCMVCMAPVEGIVPAQYAAIIAHECVHVWQEAESVMRESNAGKEVEAYAIQYFTQCMLEDFWEEA